MVVEKFENISKGILSGFDRIMCFGGETVIVGLEISWLTGKPRLLCFKSNLGVSLCIVSVGAASSGANAPAGGFPRYC